MRWPGVKAYMGENKRAYKGLVGKPEERHDLEDIGVDGRIILKFALKKYDVTLLTGFLWLRTGINGGLL
jgi:hypothetical protein